MAAGAVYCRLRAVVVVVTLMERLIIRPRDEHERGEARKEDYPGVDLARHMVKVNWQYSAAECSQFTNVPCYIADTACFACYFEAILSGTRGLFGTASKLN